MPYCIFSYKLFIKNLLNKFMNLTFKLVKELNKHAYLIFKQKMCKIWIEIYPKKSISKQNIFSTKNNTYIPN